MHVILSDTSLDTRKNSDDKMKGEEGSHRGNENLVGRVPRTV